LAARVVRKIFIFVKNMNERRQSIDKRGRGKSVRAKALETQIMRILQDLYSGFKTALLILVC